MLDRALVVADVGHDPKQQRLADEDEGSRGPQEQGVHDREAVVGPRVEARREQRAHEQHGGGFRRRHRGDRHEEGPAPRLEVRVELRRPDRHGDEAQEGPEDEADDQQGDTALGPAGKGRPPVAAAPRCHGTTQATQGMPPVVAAAAEVQVAGQAAAPLAAARGAPPVSVRGHDPPVQEDDPDKKDEAEHAARVLREADREQADRQLFVVTREAPRHRATWTEA